MKVAILAYEATEDFAKRDDASAYEAYMAPWIVYSNALSDAGVLESGGALQQPHAATTISVRDGERHIEDGPYADAKEQLGGYFLLDVPNMEAAKDWAAKCPAAATGRVEVHLIPSYGEEA